MALLNLAVACLLAADVSLDTALFNPRLLVRARAVRVVPRGTDAQTGTFIVEHVYAGPAAMRGATFEVDSLPGSALGSHFGGRNRPELEVTLEQGEVGIWTLFYRRVWVGYAQQDKLSGTFHALRRAQPGTPDDCGSIIAGDDKVDYDEAVRWAEVVERVDRAPPGQRTALLKFYSFSPDPSIARWALRNLLIRASLEGGHAVVYLFDICQLRPRDLAGFLESLAISPTASVQAAVWADHALVELAPGRWTRSPRRVRMMQRWFERPTLSEQGHHSALFDCDHAFRSRQIDFPTYVRLLHLAFSPPFDRRHHADWNRFGPFLGRVGFLYYLTDAVCLERPVNAPGLDASALGLLGSPLGQGPLLVIFGLIPVTTKPGRPEARAYAFDQLLAELAQPSDPSEGDFLAGLTARFLPLGTREQARLAQLAARPILPGRIRRILEQVLQGRVPTPPTSVAADSEPPVVDAGPAQRPGHDGSGDFPQLSPPVSARADLAGRLKWLVASVLAAGVAFLAFCVARRLRRPPKA